MNNCIIDLEEQQSKLRTLRIGRLGKGWGERVAVLPSWPESVERGRSEDLKALSKRSLGRGDELENIEDWEIE